MNITVTIADYDQMLEMIYGEDGIKDATVYDRIRYFSSSDFGWMQRDKVKPFFSVLKEGEKIIGLAKAGYFDLSAKSPLDWSISFFSIDKNYRGNGYSRMMVEAIFKHAKEKGYEISPSYYSVLGNERVKHLLEMYAEKYGVKFYQHDRMHDIESMYVVVEGKKLHYTEV